MPCKSDKIKVALSLDISGKTDKRTALGRCFDKFGLAGPLNEPTSACWSRVAENHAFCLSRFGKVVYLTQNLN